MNKELYFEKVTGSIHQKNRLYNLLKKRNYNISHVELPVIENHNNFVDNHPYREWFIVCEKEEDIGTFYIKFDNSIGLNLILLSIDVISEILKFIKSNYSPNNAKPSLIPPYFYINVASENNNLQDILEELEIKKLQISYKI